MKSNRLILAGGILAGAAAGVLIGILLAPDKGAETRRKIVDKGEDYLDDLKDKMEGMLDEVRDKIETSLDTCSPTCTCKQNNGPAKDKSVVM